MDNYDNISNYIDNIIERGSFIDIGTLLNMLNESTLDIENKITILNKAHLYNLSVIKLVLKVLEKIQKLLYTIMILKIEV